MVNVFISWSGDKSKEIAEELRNWIPSVLQFAKPYFTPNDIEKGAKWSSEISKKLAESNIGIICLTKDNLNKPWILFEAGALSKDLDRSKVCSVLFGMENSDLSGPLTTFQTTNFEKLDFRKLLLSINDAGGQSALARETFARVFEMWWPQFQMKIDAILASDLSSKDANLRSDRELLEEILLTQRSMSRNPLRTERGLPIVTEKILADFAESIGALIELNQKLDVGPYDQAAVTSVKIDMTTHLESLVKALENLADRSSSGGLNLRKLLQAYQERLQQIMPF